MIISEGYLRFEHSTAVPSLSEVARLAFPIVESAAEDFFRRFSERRKAEVVVEEGSLRLRGRVRVTAAVLASTFVGYGAVRQSIDYAWHDGRIAAGWINDQVRGLFSLSDEDVRAQRRRTPAPTRLRRLFDSVASGDLSADDAANAAEELFRDYGESTQTIQRVMQQLRSELVSVAVDQRKTPSRMPQLPVMQRTVALPGRRVSVFRDDRGNLRVIEG